MKKYISIISISILISIIGFGSTYYTYIHTGKWYVLGDKIGNICEFCNIDYNQTRLN